MIKIVCYVLLYFVINITFADELPFLVANKEQGVLTIHYPDGTMKSTTALKPEGDPPVELRSVAEHGTRGPIGMG